MSSVDNKDVKLLWRNFVADCRELAMKPGPQKMAGTKIGRYALNSSEANQGQKQLKQWISISSGVYDAFEPHTMQDFNNTKSFYTNYCNSDSLTFFQRTREIMDFVWSKHTGKWPPIRERIQRNLSCKKVLNKLVDHINDEIEEYSDFKVDRVPFDWRLELAYKAIS